MRTHSACRRRRRQRIGAGPVAMRHHPTSYRPVSAICRVVGFSRLRRWGCDQAWLAASRFGRNIDINARDRVVFGAPQLTQAIAIEGVHAVADESGRHAHGDRGVVNGGEGQRAEPAAEHAVAKVGAEAAANPGPFGISAFFKTCHCRYPCRQGRPATFQPPTLPRC